MAHTESAPTESSAESDRLSFTKLYTSPASSFYDIFGIFWAHFTIWIHSTDVEILPGPHLAACRNISWVTHCHQVKQRLPTHQSACAAFSGSLSISLFVFLCVLISFHWTIRANLKDTWFVDPVFPADLCESSVKGSTRAVHILQL